MTACAELVANVADQQDSAATPFLPQEAVVGLEAQLIRRRRWKRNYITGIDEGAILWKNIRFLGHRYDS